MSSGPPRLILASSSPRRRELLSRLGLPFTVTAADVDEAPEPGETPRQTAERLARIKAETVAARIGGQSSTFVIGADTVVIYQGKVLGKPASPAEAAAMLRELRGQSHQVVSGVAVVDAATGRVVVGSTRTEVRLRPLSDDEIRAYVASGDPLDKAGAYAIQNEEFHPVESIRGCRSNVVGLPLCTVTAALGAFGLRVTADWRTGPDGCDCQGQVSG